jgi:hypothetical protein
MVIVTTREITRRISSKFRSRSLEWEHTVMMILFGFIVLVNPAIFEGPGFVAFWGGPYLWGSFILLFGIVRLAALCVNGYMAKPTAMVRALGAGCGILVFAALTLGFLFSWRWSTALSMYPVVGFFGLFPLAWSILDVALPDTNTHGNDPS